MNITICGGGNMGHVCAGFLAAQEGNSVSLLTTKPSEWSKSLNISDPKGYVYHGDLETISNKPSDVITCADIVLICLPGFAIADVLKTIAPFLNTTCWVGTIVSCTGFFFEAFKHLPPYQPLFGFQRVPFISRITKYGREAELKGYKESLNIAVEQTENKEAIRRKVEELFKTPVVLLSSHYEVSLSNSNPLLHTARLYTMWKNWKPGMSYEKNPEFYSDWTIEASELLIAMDEEFQILLKKIGIKEGAIPNVLDYYESTNAKSLTQKLRSISAFKGISSPMQFNDLGKYIPDFSSRYFIEDFPYGMKYIVETANSYNVNCPQIMIVYTWGVDIVKKK